MGVIVIESRNTSGLKLGDIIISVDGISISSASDIELLLKGKNVGDTLTVKIKRDGSEKSVSLPLTEKVPDSVSFD